MARRSNPCIVQTPHGDHELPSHEWHHYVRSGLLIEIGRKLAKPARNVVAWLHAGKLQLLHVYSIFTFSMLLERHAPAIQKHEERKLARQYGTASFWASVGLYTRLYGDIEEGQFLTK